MFTDVKKAIVNVLNEANETTAEIIEESNEFKNQSKEEKERNRQQTLMFIQELMFRFIDELSIVNRERVGDDEVERICRESQIDNGEIDESLQDFLA